MRYITLALCLLLGTVALPACVSAPADSTTADHEQRIQLLEQKIEELQRELESLRAEKAVQETPAPEESENLSAPQTVQSTGNEKLLPDISAIVDTVGTFSTDNDVENNDDILLRGIELGVQGYIYPGVRGDVFIAAEGEDLGLSVEEAYATFLRLGPNLSANVGKEFIDFGKNNSVHREKWPFVTQPFVVRNLLNPEEGLTGQGVQAHYLLPTKGDLYSQLTVGIWSPSAEEEDAGGLGLGVEDRLYSGRLMLSRPIRDDSEIEFGVSAAGGRGEADLGHPSTRIYGLDATYRIWPGDNRRILFQGETMRQKRDIEDGGGSRDGYYLLGDYRLNQYDAVGMRYDWSERPAPSTGHDSGLSAFYTRSLSETSFLRLQLTREHDAETGDATTAYLQMVWGLGPHAHELQ